LYLVECPPATPNEATAKRIQRERESAANAFARKTLSLAAFMAKAQTLDEQEQAFSARQEAAQGHMSAAQANWVPKRLRGYVGTGR